jgi:hypothetical protein
LSRLPQTPLPRRKKLSPRKRKQFSEHRSEVSCRSTHTVPKLLEASIHARLRPEHQLFKLASIHKKRMRAEFDSANDTTESVVGVPSANE